jgi:cob(I)alamin adenosyltransferase
MVLRIVPGQVEWLETAIDRAQRHAAPAHQLHLPGGSEAAARVHLARAIARRAERAIAALAAAEPVNPAALTYVNRLSDYLSCWRGDQCRALTRCGCRRLARLIGAKP